MATETMTEFLARGGSIEKSSSSEILAEFLQKEGILNKKDAEKVTNEINKSFVDSIKVESKDN